MVGLDDETALGFARLPRLVGEVGPDLVLQPQLPLVRLGRVIRPEAAMGDAQARVDLALVVDAAREVWWEVQPAVLAGGFDDVGDDVGDLLLAELVAEGRHRTHPLRHPLDHERR